jgi:hypothetical protein
MEEKALIEQLPELNIVDFVEKVSGIKLTVYQKKMLEIFADLPEGSTIVMGRKGPMILDGNGKRIDHVKESYERRK